MIKIKDDVGFNRKLAILFSAYQFCEKANFQPEILLMTQQEVNEMQEEILYYRKITQEIEKMREDMGMK